MPRLYLICLLLLSAEGWGQKQLQRLVAHADAQVVALDYIEALKYYDQALALEPNSIALHWKIAQANQQFKDYKTAARYYLKVYEQDPDGQQFAEAQLQYALMLKQQGLYKEALAQFKEVKKFFSEDKKSNGYLKSNQEIIACNWVLKQLKYVSAEELADLKKHPVNTVNAEFAHLFWNDTLVYSSLKADSIAEDQEQILSRQYKLDIYQFPNPKDAQQLVLNGQKTQFEYGNFCIAPDSSFALCSECTRTPNQFGCHIVRALPQNGNWNLDSTFQLDGLQDSYNSMPHLFELNAQLMLVYSAQQANGLGGTDLWLATFNKEGQIKENNNLGVLNSIENEVSPWYDPLFKRLYFSSTWHAGFGGFDIFYSNLQADGSFGPPINLGLPFNSPANDLYFFCQADTAYLSSNRLGSLYASHPTCCSDVFYQELLRPKEKKDQIVSETVQVVKLPIKLYFENDHPNPKSTADFTELSYEETYLKYKGQYPVYLQKVTEGRDATATLQQTQSLLEFFETEVDKGMQDLALFREQVWQELQSGKQVSIMVQGFASPLAKSDYNVHLTNRRISAIKNYFEEIDGGKFAPYMLTTPSRLQFIEVPMGEYKANKDVSDNYYDQRNSVYSKDASLERRIEIIELRTETLPPR
jgi:tetratricopeptide (TPR) repeat protein